MTIRVAITGVSGDVGLGAIRGLRADRNAEEDIWMLGLDGTEDCAGRHLVDAYATLPPVAGPTYIAGLVSQLRLHAIDVLLPGIDSEICILSRARHELAKTATRIALAPAELIEAAEDKIATAALLSACGLKAPTTRDADNPLDLGFPLVAKPRRGHGSHGVNVLTDAQSLNAFLNEGRTGYCLQRYIEGPEFSVGFLYDWNGVLRDAIPMERTLEGGRTVRATVVKTPEILRFIEDFGSRIRGMGAVNAQLRMDPVAGPLVFEINARLSGSTAMRVAVGFNDPLRIVKHLARGVPIERSSIRQATVYRLPTELVVETQ